MDFNDKEWLISLDAVDKNLPDFYTILVAMTYSDFLTVKENHKLYPKQKQTYAVPQCQDHCFLHKNYFKDPAHLSLMEMSLVSFD